MTFEQDVFISYAHLDNEELLVGQQTPERKSGWITILHGTLQTMLSQRLGAKARIWRDRKLHGDDIFAGEILAQLSKAASLVSVLTPRYVCSEWCIKEINAFCQAADANGGVAVGEKSRVFKVLKAPIQKEDSLPAIVKQVLGYQFFEYEDDGTPLELDPLHGDQARVGFLRKVNKLAWDIAQLLARLDVGSTPPPAGGPPKPLTGGPDKPVIYLAECTRDRREARELLEAELQRHGYVILPDRPLPSEEEDYVAEVERLLERCRFSIHLVGSRYGLVPEGPSQKSVVVLQNDLAAKRSRAGGLERVISLPEGTQSNEASQQAFIDALHQSAEMQFGADLVTGDLEDLKGAIHAALKKLEQVTAPRPARPNGKLVYVRCDQKDRMESVPLQKFLKGRGLEVKLPVFTGDATQVREANQELATSCDAVILFYGAGDEAWKYHQENELKKLRGLRRDRPLAAVLTYLARPATEDKQLLLALAEQDVINGLEGFSEPTMDAFLQALNVRGASP